MPTHPPGEYLASNGVFYRLAGRGEPLLLLHGLMASGAMFDPLVELLQDQFQMIIPDLRGHGRSGALPGPYDVPALAADLDAVLDDAGAETCAVLGYSHGGAVAQQLAHTRQSVVTLLLVCTYACNASTPRERVEAGVLQILLRLLSTKTLAGLIIQPSKSTPDGAIGLNVAQADRLKALMGRNGASQMREAARALVTFDSRPWLRQITVPTLVVGGTHDTGVPQHHFDTLLSGIPGARGKLIERAGHTLLWTHTRELAEIVRTESRKPASPAVAVASAGTYE
jgi:3-oxoadipate enol-lactonase